MPATHGTLAACLLLAASCSASCGRDRPPQGDAPPAAPTLSETARLAGSTAAAAASVAPGDAAAGTCAPVPVRVTLRVLRTAARGSSQGSLQAQLVASSLELRRTVFDSPLPVTCKAAADDAGGLLELRCVGDLTETRGVVRVSGPALEVEVASGYFGAMPPDVPRAIGHTTERFSLPCGARVSFATEGVDRADGGASRITDPFFLGLEHRSV